MVPDLIWAPRNLVPEKFGPREIWAPQKLVPALKCYIMIFMQGPKFLVLKVLRAQISWGPKTLGDQMRPGTISVIAQQNR